MYTKRNVAKKQGMKAIRSKKVVKNKIRIYEVRQY